MERSRLKLLIKYHLDLCKDHMSTDELSDGVLKICELAGMLPPNNGKKIHIKKGSIPCVLRVESCYRWDDENDK